MFRRKLLIPALLSLFLIVLACKGEPEKEEKYEFTNALVNETSPYLLQHAHNPVNWRPWSEEALEEAAKEDKLVLVSIGYSSCHWCHVMEEETFEDTEVAELMNKNFINIKVDREERPDIDQVYMTALQLLQGSGGWPLNVITLPDGKPLYGGTYHTKEEWMTVLQEISTLYKESPERAREYADKVAQGIQAVNLVSKPAEDQVLNQQKVKQIVNTWGPQWDLEYGGQKGQQKFMLPVNISFLMQYAFLAQDNHALSFVQSTMDHMARGGVYDQLGGGFYRYSTDDRWQIPHFEKMLYDNAQLIALYAEGYSLLKNQEYANVIEETTDYLEREMRHPNGAYYAALDADSEGEEGKYYTWKTDSLKTVLGSSYDEFAAYYGIQGKQPWENNTYILSRPQTDSMFISTRAMDKKTLDRRKAEWKNKLLPLRNKRIRPGVDDKIITSWNALLISGFISAHKALGESHYLQKAKDIYRFLVENNMKGKQLVHTYKKGSEQEEGFLEDYAYFIRAALDLYSVTTDEQYLDSAREMLELTDRKFYNSQNGLYRFKDDNELIATIYKTDDGVLPSPNAVMAENLLILGHLDYNKTYLKRSTGMLQLILPMAEQSPDLYAKWNSVLLQIVFPYYEVAVVGPDAVEKLKELNAHFLPNALLVGAVEKSGQALFKNRFVPGDTFIYVCRDHSCKMPVTSVPNAIQLLDRPGLVQQ
ncbi:thioredoxin domain-containing protein [Zeaxanthinibacter sp. PT1]|uniref:thioredoxin domain-containing protein n=1 Tax=Zeaxanthinibacter TaxID=561554 RepID=UPI00234B7C69|nr:thioredoxin domain-containing protein [Zeaxanthinibacter sp. PT1]MDC6352728.1 thioredoxin domain-containing protein [Zeaxanthinibacter sp. PT1]